MPWCLSVWDFFFFDVWKRDAYALVVRVICVVANKSVTDAEDLITEIERLRTEGPGSSENTTVPK